MRTKHNSGRRATARRFFDWVYLNFVERQTLRVSVVEHESLLMQRNPKGVNRFQAGPSDLLAGGTCKGSLHASPTASIGL